MCLSVFYCCLVACVFFFFFKQKTAYEMRISDWSSDVCSSDLLSRTLGRPDLAVMVGRNTLADGSNDFTVVGYPSVKLPAAHQGDFTIVHAIARQESQFDRSEEHTSELQSLMRISYADFCLKKKKNIINSTKTSDISYPN